MPSDFAGFQCHAIQNRSKKKSKLVSRLHNFWLLYCRITSGFFQYCYVLAAYCPLHGFPFDLREKKKSVLFSSLALISNYHVLQIHLLQIHVLQIHVLQIHLLQIHVLPINFYKSMFYKSTFYKSTFYKSMFYKSTFYKSTPCFTLHSSPLHSTPLHVLQYARGITLPRMYDNSRKSPNFKSDFDRLKLCN